MLAAFYLEQLNARYGEAKTLSIDAMQALARCDWPGNVRQLRYALESAYVMTTGPTIQPEQTPIGKRSSSTPSTVAAADENGRFPMLYELECTYVKRALQTTAGHRMRAAELLGVSKRSLYRLLARHHIEA